MIEWLFVSVVFILFFGVLGKKFFARITLFWDVIIILASLQCLVKGLFEGFCLANTHTDWRALLILACLNDYSVSHFCLC